MSEPSREHLEAVAGIAADHIGDAKDPADPHSWRCYDKVRYPGDCGCTWALANDFLTSTDPAVLDAMQDALVRAGRLRIEHECYADSCYVHFFTEWQEVEP